LDVLTGQSGDESGDGDGGEVHCWSRGGYFESLMTDCNGSTVKVLKKCLNQILEFDGFFG
jgi:hypothetical protein